MVVALRKEPTQEEIEARLARMHEKNGKFMLSIIIDREIAVALARMEHVTGLSTSSLMRLALNDGLVRMIENDNGQRS